MFTNRDALPYELAAVADAISGRYHPPDPHAEPDAFAAYRRAWTEQADRDRLDPSHAAAVILGAVMLRRGAAA